MTQPRHPGDEQLWTGGEAVEEHLAGCPGCRARLHALDERQQHVSGWLRAGGGTSTASPRMPDDVTARLDEVLRQEAGRRTTEGEVRPLRRSAEPRRAVSPRAWLVAAAAAAVAVVGGALLVPTLGGDDLVAGGGDDAAAQAVDPTGDTSAEAGLAPVPAVPADVAEQAQSRTTDATRGSCGQALADQLGGTVVAVTEVAVTEVAGEPRGGVLVTVDTDGLSVLWWLPTCQSTIESAWGRSPLN